MKSCPRIQNCTYYCNSECALFIDFIDGERIYECTEVVSAKALYRLSKKDEQQLHVEVNPKGKKLNDIYRA